MKAILKIILITLVLYVPAAEAYCQVQNDYAKKVPAELLKQDFRVLRDSLENLHAGLYRYKTKDEMNAMFDRCYQQLDRPMTLTSFFAIVSSLVSSIED